MPPIDVYEWAVSRSAFEFQGTLAEHVGYYGVGQIHYGRALQTAGAPVNEQ